MNIQNKICFLSFLAISLLATSSAFADRITHFSNHSNYYIRIWGNDCSIQLDGLQECGESFFIGVLPPHQELRISKKELRNSNRLGSTNANLDTWDQAGVVITRAEIDTGYATVFPNGLITDFLICSDIHKDEINGNLILDFDDIKKKITCKNTLGK